MMSKVSSHSFFALIIKFCISSRSLMSWNTRTTPMMLPFSSLIGAPLSSIGILVPSLAVSTAFFARPTSVPSPSTFFTGFSIPCPVSSLIILNTSSTAFPPASSCFQPVNTSAAGFINITQPSVSVAITASPILLSTVESHSWLSFNFFSIPCL